jgi:hypothetical protein
VSAAVLGEAAAAADDRADASSRLLTAQLGRVRARLLAAAGHGDETDVAAADDAAEQAAAQAGTDSSLHVLRTVFALTDFEVDVVLLAAAYELDARVAQLCADAGDPRRPYPTFALALALLPHPHWSALTPGAPLRTWRLVETGSGPLTTAPVQLDERVLHALLGIEQLDRRLEPYAVPVVTTHEIPPSHRALALDVAAAWTSGAASIVRVSGVDEADRRAVVAVAAAATGRGLHVVRAADLPAGIDERDALVRLWQREQALAGRALLVEVGDHAEEHLAASLLTRLSGPVAVSARDRTAGGPATWAVEVDTPTHDERLALWRDQLAAATTPADHDMVADVCAQFDLPASGVGAVTARVAGAPLDRARLWQAAREHSRPQLAGLAQRIDVRASWGDLVLPAAHLAALRDIVVHVRRRPTVHDAWGFALAGSRGLGITALFAGPSGTGKTLAAEVLAHELDLDLYRIDLSAVVSKYIGETEKNLRRVFDAAEGGGAVLLFDEADALFGKRSEVRDSHDRYANIEVSYLLQRMETYRGLAILTTNLRGSLDDAFSRRLRFVVQFPFPDVAQRRALWAQAFPPGVPREDLDVDELARLSVTGGNIANIALSAAFGAAERGDRVRRADLLRAAQAEYAKLDRPLTDSESGGLR